jgi:hypothetical protein
MYQTISNNPYTDILDRIINTRIGPTLIYIVLAQFSPIYLIILMVYCNKTKQNLKETLAACTIS